MKAHKHGVSHQIPGHHPHHVYAAIARGLCEEQKTLDLNALDIHPLLFRRNHKPHLGFEYPLRRHWPQGEEIIIYGCPKRHDQLEQNDKGVVGWEAAFPEPRIVSPEGRYMNDAKDAFKSAQIIFDELICKLPGRNLES